MTGLLRAELRKSFSTRMWWGLLIPVLALSVLVNALGGVFTDALEGLGEGSGSGPPLMLASLAYDLALTSVFSAVVGVVATAGEFRHRTITTTYLTASGRGSVLLAKLAAAGVVGALYAGGCVVVGIPAALLSGSSSVPDAGTLLAVAGIGVAVSALWAALGAALGTAIANQVGALVGVLVYLLLGELLLSALISRSDDPATARISSFLPGNAGDVALYDIPARFLAGPDYGTGVVELLVGVTAPPPWWGALLVLAAWAAAAAAVGWVVGARRDIT